MRLKGKTALITGAGDGIGAATALAFVREGAQVTATDRDKEKLHRLRAEGVQNVTVLDVADIPAIDACTASFDSLDILFNCAGHVTFGSIEDCTEEEWKKSFDVNVSAMYRMIRGSLSALRGSNGASIINMSSTSSSLRGVPKRFAYGTAKAAIIGLTRSVAADFVSENIRCNAICPGVVDTPGLRHRLSTGNDFNGTLEGLAERQPIGRIGKPEDIANLVVYLASDESAYVTGSVFTADGGWTGIG
ncbi:MAG: SDR family oxidoreductase [Rhodospirillaceae bacterium]